MWIEITSPTPVLNTPNFNAVFGAILTLDPHIEFVALQSMQFEVLDQVSPHILQISCPSYSPNPLYIDRRFCQTIEGPVHAAPRGFLAEPILRHMESRVGTPYVWGGNWARGIPELLTYYPPQKPLDRLAEIFWTMEGLDCSGLLFEATNGATPRNTSHLLHFGRALLPGELLKPLDMILYPGHVLFVRDDTTIIESKHPMGVRICPIKQRMDEIANFTSRRFSD